MLKQRSRSLALLARALQRSSGAIGSQQKTKKTPSFAIAAAFEGHEDLEDDEGTDQLYEQDMEIEDAEDERVRALKEQLQRGMEKKKLWMQSLTEQKLYAAIVKTVADCYAPLYAAMGLEGKCPLLTVARDKSKGEHELETQYRPLRFDDMLTKATEQEAMALLVIANQSMLALTIVEHRDKLAEELAKRAKAGTGVVLPGTNVMEDEHVVTLGSHLRMFYSWATSAYASCGPDYYPQLFAIYKRAQDAKVYVTANMNVQYMTALTTEKRYDELFEFYETVVRESLPTSVFFYRQMLFAVSATRKVELLDSILEDMRVKGFKLREEDYLRAIRTYDNDYFFTEMKRHRSSHKHCDERKAKEIETVLVTPRDSYDMCLTRIREQEEHPERFEKLLNAVHSVLALFDTMVDIDGLTPRDTNLFPRVITAAVYAQECERIPELLAHHAEHADEPLHYAGVRMAVNALLLLEKPTEAWGLVRETNPHLEPRRFALVGNIFNYLCMRKRGAEIIALMHDVDKLEAHGVFTLAVIKSLVPALCRSVDTVSDEELMMTMTHFDKIFRLRTSEHHFGVFLRECCHNKRLAVVKDALKQWLATSGNKRPLKGAVAVKVLETFEGESDWAFMADVFEMVDFSQVLREDDRKTIVSSASRAYEALGRPEQVKRAEHVSMIAAKRQKQLRQRKVTKPQKERFSATHPSSMLAEAACRRSSWLRSMATTRRLARPLQVQATARSREDDEETADKRPSVAKGRRPPTTEPQSLNFHLQMHSSGIGDLLAAAEHKNPSAKRGSDLNIAENVAMQADATAGDFSLSLNFHLQMHSSGIGDLLAAAEHKNPSAKRGSDLNIAENVAMQADATAGDFSLVTNESPAEKDIDRAKGSLQKLARSLADPRAAVARESGFQRARRQLKAATGKLDRMLSAMRLRRDYAQVEAVAFLWEKEFPQFAGQRKH
ncbi:Hypothetical protein PHPALM_14995, partial [Phytophthora palmivora]